MAEPEAESQTAGIAPCGSGGRSVTAILLNYNAPAAMMFKCLDSLRRQTYDDFKVLLVDNASAVDILGEVAERYPEVELLKLDRNHGFSGGINRGVAACDSEYVFLLNYDTVVEPECVAAMVAVIAAEPVVVGVAPKMMLTGHPRIFDSIGIALGDNAGAFNQGIGQPDIGQYDRVEPAFGACFGATLLRRCAFRPDQVGPLDESYFMYFEDFDWCYRANLLKLEFRTAPAAVVHHEHSASVKDRSYNFKFRLIERNLLRTVIKDYQRRMMVKIPLRRLRSHLMNAISPRSGRAGVSWRIIGAFFIDFFRFLPKRWAIQRRRLVSDDEILRHSFGEQPYFNPTDYTPFYEVGTLAAAYRRLYAVTGDERALNIYGGLEALNQSKARFDDGLLRSRLEELLADEPEHVKEFAALIK
ncbi:MAG: glycosyltransferase family 2 protein [Thermoleophilia bacterium]